MGGCARGAEDGAGAGAGCRHGVDGAEVSVAAGAPVVAGPWTALEVQTLEFAAVGESDVASEVVEEAGREIEPVCLR